MEVATDKDLDTKKVLIRSLVLATLVSLFVVFIITSSMLIEKIIEHNEALAFKTTANVKVQKLSFSPRSNRVVRIYSVEIEQEKYYGLIISASSLGTSYRVKLLMRRDGEIADISLLDQEGPAFSKYELMWLKEFVGFKAPILGFPEPPNFFKQDSLDADIFALRMHAITDVLNEASSLVRELGGNGAL